MSNGEAMRAASTSPGAGDLHPGTPVALVTGASSGIGLATARLLAESGYDVMLTGRSAERLSQTRERIRGEQAVRVETRIADLGEPEEAARVVRETIEGFGRLDVLVNNAGMASVRTIPDCEDGYIRENFALNVFGPMSAIREAWAHWVGRRAGCVVNISSWAAMDPFPGFFVYGSTKAALNGVTRSCHADGADAGVRAFSVCPGAVETPMLRASFDEATVGQRVVPGALGCGDCGGGVRARRAGGRSGTGDLPAACGGWRCGDVGRGLSGVVHAGADRAGLVQGIAERARCGGGDGAGCAALGG
jgi:short-subunit dehydrogenase